MWSKKQALSIYCIPQKDALIVWRPEGTENPLTEDVLENIEYFGVASVFPLSTGRFLVDVDTVKDSMEESSSNKLDIPLTRFPETSSFLSTDAVSTGDSVVDPFVDIVEPDTSVTNIMSVVVTISSE